VTSPRLRVSSSTPSNRRRGRGAGEPATNPVPPLDDQPWLLDSHQVAQLLGIGRTKAFQLMARRELPVVRIGRCVRVPRTGLEDWIRRSTLIELDNVTVGV
jgi:excisionase family DNA binding protein